MVCGEEEVFVVEMKDVEIAERKSRKIAGTGKCHSLD